MNEELAKRYEPAEFEQRIYQFWERGEYFTPVLDKDRPKFSIVIPPPNVTGRLHIGHALVNTLQDIVVRWKRMSGFNTLWLPGTDHAGIATQMVVDRELAKEGISRFDLGREKFVERIWEWKEQHAGLIKDQLTRLGSSADWKRERFTLDPGLSRAVRHVFVSLYEEGLIYRGSGDGELVPLLPHGDLRHRSRVSRAQREALGDRVSGRRLRSPASKSPPHVPRRCSETRLSPCIPTTNATRN